MTDDRRGTNAVITGGGRGFGLAFGHALAARGAHVALIDSDGDAAARAAGAIRDAGGLATAHEGDVTDEAAIVAIMAETAARHGGIDLLVNNAGLHSHAFSQPIVEMGAAKTRRLLDVNVNGIVICTLAAHPHMIGRAGPSIVNIASSAAYLGARAHAYGVSKLAAAALTVVFAGELGADGIRVNAIAPGMILTDTIRRELPEAVKETARAMQLIGRDGEERDIVEALLFLTSTEARFITGETLRVTGGAAAGV